MLPKSVTDVVDHLYITWAHRYSTPRIIYTAAVLSDVSNNSRMHIVVTARWQLGLLDYYSEWRSCRAVSTRDSIFSKDVISLENESNEGVAQEEQIPVLP
jgi:hypothetical protein